MVFGMFWKGSLWWEGMVLLFSFVHREDMAYVVANGPCDIHGVLLIVDFWRPKMVLDQLDISKFEISVRLFGLPV